MPGYRCYERAVYKFACLFLQLANPRIPPSSVMLTSFRMRSSIIRNLILKDRRFPYSPFWGCHEHHTIQIQHKRFFQGSPILDY